ncbi:MAG: hypothetical protein KJ630_03420, partial [Proteobacteria bacterium]|nr:hypothetical protein [Pseudomonadota bacterium]
HPLIKSIKKARVSIMTYRFSVVISAIPPSLLFWFNKIVNNWNKMHLLHHNHKTQLLQKTSSYLHIAHQKRNPMVCLLSVHFFLSSFMIPKKRRGKNK